MSLNRTFYFLLLISAAALFFRVWLSIDHFHKADAIFIAKMAQDIVTGQNFPLIYYGQNYMGTIESWITAPLFYFTGPTWWGIGFAPIIVSTLGVFAFFLLGRSLADDRAGLFAAILWAVTPFSMMFYNITPRGPYPEIVCGSALALYFAVEKIRGKKFSSSAGFAMGLILGLMLWTSVLSAPAIAVVLFFTLIADGRGVISKTNVAGFIGFVVGGSLYLPQAIAAKGEKTLGIDFSILEKNAKALSNTIYESFLPYPAMNPPEWLFWTQNMVFAVLVISFLVMTIVTFFRFIKKEEGEPRGGHFFPVIVFTLLFSAAFLANPKGLAAQSRHILPLYIPLIAAAAVALSKIAESRAIVALFVAGLMALSNGYLNVFTFGGLANDMAAEKKTVEEATDQLTDLGVHSLVNNDYELRNRLTWEAETRGYRLDTMDFSGSRDPKMTLAVERDQNAVLGFTATYAETFKDDYRACCGEDFRVEFIPTMGLLFPGKPILRATESIPPEEWELEGELKALGDRKFTTTLATDSSFTIALNSPAEISRIRIVYGGRTPSKMALSISNDASEWLTVKSALPPSFFVPSGVKTFFRTGDRPEREFEEINFPPVTGRFIKFEVYQQAGQIFDIHELFIYKAAKKTELMTDKIPSPADVASAASKNSIKLLATDRWLTASLYGEGHPFELVLPPFRSFEARLQVSRLHPAGLGALVELSDETELSTLLKKRDIGFEKTKLDGRALFALKNGDGELWWTGFTFIDW